MLLVDCDPWGAGLDVLLGIETEPGLRWGDLAAPSGRLQVDALRRALPGVTVGSGRVAVLCHGRRSGSDIGPDVLDVVLDAGRRMGAATVIDLPRQPGPGRPIGCWSRRISIVLVTPADVRGCWAADRVCARIRQFGTTAGAGGPRTVARRAWAPPNWPMCWACRCSRGCGRIRRWPRDLEVGLALGADRRRPLAKAARAVLSSLRAAA